MYKSDNIYEALDNIYESTDNIYESSDNFYKSSDNICESHNDRKKELMLCMGSNIVYQGHNHHHRCKDTHTSLYYNYIYL